MIQIFTFSCRFISSHFGFPKLNFGRQKGHLIIIIIIWHAPSVAPLAANSPHSGLSRAISIASSKVRLCRDRSFFRVAIQEEWGHPTGLLQSLWGTAVRILLASADSSILIRCPNSMSLVFCMIEVRRGCLVRRRTSQLVTRWYQCISRILRRHH